MYGEHDPYLALLFARGEEAGDEPAGPFDEPPVDEDDLRWSMIAAMLAVGPLLL